MGLCPNAIRHTADPLQQIQIVRTLVKQDAAALAFPGCPPIPGIKIRPGTVPIRDDPVHPPYSAQFPVLHDFFHLAVDMVGALVEHNPKDFPRSVRRLVHITDIEGADPRGFFGQDVQAAPEGGYGIFRVAVMGRGD